MNTILNKAKQVTKKAFTIVELIVVITIIAVLATIATTSIGWVGDSADKTAVVTNMKTLSSAITNYQLEAGKLPIANDDDGIATVGDGKIGYLTVNSSFKSKIDDTFKTDAKGILTIKGNKVYYAKDASGQYFALAVKFTEAWNDKTYIVTSYPADKKTKTLFTGLTQEVTWTAPTIAADVDSLIYSVKQANGDTKLYFAKTAFPANTVVCKDGTSLQTSTENANVKTITDTLAIDDKINLEDTDCSGSAISNTSYVQGSGLGL